jgi:hypothetical protein
MEKGKTKIKLKKDNKLDKQKPKGTHIGKNCT